MKYFQGILLFIACITHTAIGYREITGLLDGANDLSREEVNALRPLFQELQLQYDHIAAEASQSESKPDDKFAKLYEDTLNDFQQQFTDLLAEKTATVYDTSLPTVEQLMGEPDFTQMTTEQRNEFLDMQSILQETLDEMQHNMDELVSRALQVESELLKINKPKIIIAILNALGVLFNVSARVGRAAYCTYSHVPQLNASLHHIYEGVDCYLYTTSLIVKIQKETYETVKIVKKNVFELVDVYKKVASKNSLMGKVVSLLMNLKKITWSVFGTLRQANHVIDEVVHQLPGAAAEVQNCGTNFVDNIPYVVESVSNVTTCMMFVDDTTKDYGFLDPENSTRIPELYPDPESGEIDGSFEMD